MLQFLVYLFYRNCYWHCEQNGSIVTIMSIGSVTGFEICFTKVLTIRIIFPCIISACYYYLQIGIIVLVVLMYEPRATFRQKVQTEPYVEFLCEIPLTGLIISFVFNILLIMLCVVRILLFGNAKNSGWTLIEFSAYNIDVYYPTLRYACVSLALPLALSVTRMVYEFDI